MILFVCGIALFACAPKAVPELQGSWVNSINTTQVMMTIDGNKATILPDLAEWAVPIVLTFGLDSNNKFEFTRLDREVADRNLRREIGASSFVFTDETIAVRWIDPSIQVTPQNPNANVVRTLTLRRQTS
jgi:hypothetical protein